MLVTFLLLPASLLLLIQLLLLESRKMNKTYMIVFTVVDYLASKFEKYGTPKEMGQGPSGTKHNFLLSTFNRKYNPRTL